MRYRERDNRESFSPLRQITGNDHNCTSVTGTASPLAYPYYTGKFESMNDVVTPRFDSRVASGEVIVNPMTKVSYEREVNIAPMAYNVVKPGQPCPFRRQYVENPQALNIHDGPVGHRDVNIDVASLRFQAGTRAAAAVASPQFAGSTFLAELHETIYYLRNPLESWNEFLRQASKDRNRSRFKRSQLLTNFIVDSWLAYRYAVRPIVNDAQNAIKAIESTVLARPKRYTARGSASSSGSDSDTVVTASSGSGLGYTYTHTTNTTYSVRAGILYEYSRDPNTFGFQFRDFPVALWEAIPFSFVVDWFANIGPWIEAIAPKAGVKELGAWTVANNVSASTRQTWWSYGGTTGGYPRNIEANCLSTEVYTSETKTRTPNISVGITHRLEPLSGDLGTGRILDLLGIGQQLLRPRSREIM